MNPNTEAVDTSQAPKFSTMAPGYEWKNDGKKHSMIVINCLSIEAMKRKFIDSRQVSFMDVDSLTTPNDISFESLLGLRYTAAYNTSSMHRFCCVFLIIISENGILV